MTGYKLNIGDVVTSSREASYTCYGLGSCIGLFIQDRVAGVSGGAHIQLPDDQAATEVNKFYSVSLAITEILNRFKAMGSTLKTLRAKLAGGANVLGVETQTGKRNVERVLAQLVENQIFIAALDVGGTQPRTATFHSPSGEMIVRLAETNELKSLTKFYSTCQKVY